MKVVVDEGAFRRPVGKEHLCDQSPGENGEQGIRNQSGGSEVDERRTVSPARRTTREPKSFAASLLEMTCQPSRPAACLASRLRMRDTSGRVEGEDVTASGRQMRRKMGVR